MDRGRTDTDARPAEIHDISHANEKQSVEIRVIGEMLKQRTAVRSDKACLGRVNAGQRLEARLVGVEQDAAVAHDSNLGRIGRATSFGPGLRTIVNVPGAKPDEVSRSPFPPACQKQDSNQDECSDLEPRPSRNVARRNRLRLAGPVRCRLPEARRKRALADAADLRLVGVRMRNR